MTEDQFMKSIGAKGSMIRFEKMEAIGPYESQWPLFMKSIPFGRYLSDKTVAVDKAKIRRYMYFL